MNIYQRNLVLDLYVCTSGYDQLIVLREYSFPLVRTIFYASYSQKIAQISCVYLCIAVVALADSDIFLLNTFNFVSSLHFANNSYSDLKKIVSLLNESSKYIN